VPKFGLRLSCEEARFVQVIPGAETEVSSAGRVDISHVDSLVDKLECDGRLLVVLRCKPSIGTLAPLLWPILKWCLQSSVRIANEPVLDNVLPGTVLWTGRAVRTSNWDPRNHEAMGELTSHRPGIPMLICDGSAQGQKGGHDNHEGAR
jgi:hypothetical protein